MAAADLKKLGLNDKRIKETLKNESLTTKLSQAAKNLPENPDKNICTLTYNLVTKAKQDSHIDLILPLILNQNILMESQLESGLKFLHKTLDSEINQKSLNNACGVGQIADENVVNTVVADVINSIKSELTQQRCKYPKEPKTTEKVEEAPKYDSIEDLIRGSALKLHQPGGNSGTDGYVTTKHTEASSKSIYLEQ